MSCSSIYQGRPSTKGNGLGKLAPFTATGAVLGDASSILQCKVLGYE